MEEMRKAYPMGDMVMYERKPSPLAGKTVVITGKLWRFTRKEAHQQLLSRGAIVKRTVTKKTDYLVRGGEARSQTGQGHRPGDSHLVGAGVSHHASSVTGSGAPQ